MTTFSADTFNRTSGPVSTADIGGAWTASGAASTWAVDSNQLTGQSKTGYEGLLTVNDGQPDGAVQATFVAGSSVGLVFRYTSRNDFWALTFGAKNYIKLNYFNNGYSNKANPGMVAAVGDVFRVELSGSAIAVFRNGAQIIATTDSTRASATGHGFLISGTGLSKFDDFTHTSLSTSPTPPPTAPPTPTRTVRRFFNVGGKAVQVT